MRIELHTGDRERLFELAEDSSAAIGVGGIELRNRVWVDLQLDGG
jgi:hypothetical protein